MKFEKTVSIIVPCFNMEHSLEQAFDTLLANDFADMEVIAVDDGSRYAQKHACLV